VGSFESGVGASVSRSVDDGTGIGLDGTTNITRSPLTSRPGPPPLTAASQLAQQPKSRSLDTGLERESGHVDSDLVRFLIKLLLKAISNQSRSLSVISISVPLQSSGGFSENHNYDDASSLAVDRGKADILQVLLELYFYFLPSNRTNLQRTYSLF